MVSFSLRLACSGSRIWTSLVLGKVQRHGKARSMKRVYKQTILDDDGNVYATRTVEFNEDERTYKSPVFISNLMKLERDFLDEMFEVTTEVIE